MKKITVRLQDEQAAILQNVASELGISMSEAVRGYLPGYVPPKDAKVFQIPDGCMGLVSAPREVVIKARRIYGYGSPNFDTKIAAIKCLREHLGVGLKGAKDFVESLVFLDLKV